MEGNMHENSYQSRFANDKILNMEKRELLNIIGNLAIELDKREDDFKKLVNLRLYHLERNQYMSDQYNQREFFEITGNQRMWLTIPSGHKISYGSSEDVPLRRPERVRIRSLVKGDRTDIWTSWGGPFGRPSDNS